MTAIDCRDVAAGERAEAWIADLSTIAVGVRTALALHPGDRLEFHGRLFDLALDVEVEVVSARPSPGGDSSMAGCAFTNLAADQRLALERMLLGWVAQDDLGLSEAFRRSA